MLYDFITKYTDIFVEQDLSQEQDSSPIKNFNVKLFANAYAATNANADAGGSTIALPGLCPGELKKCKSFSLFQQKI